MTVAEFEVESENVARQIIETMRALLAKRQSNAPEKTARLFDIMLAIIEGRQHLHGVLVYKVARIVKLPDPAALKLAATVCMLIAASEVADDAMDGANTRYGKKAAHVQSDPALVQMAVFELVFLSIATLNSMREDHIKAEKLWLVNSLLMDTLFNTGLGQTLDLVSRLVNLSIEEHEQLNKLKFAELITFSLIAPVILVGTAGRLENAFKVYGLLLGEALQLINDLQDTFPEEITGKAAGEDKSKLSNLVELQGIDHLHKRVAFLLAEARRALKGLGKDFSFFRALCGIQEEKLKQAFTRAKQIA